MIRFARREDFDNSRLYFLGRIDLSGAFFLR
jgi:hypothetical protein